MKGAAVDDSPPPPFSVSVGIDEIGTRQDRRQRGEQHQHPHDCCLPHPLPPLKSRFAADDTTKVLTLDRGSQPAPNGLLTGRVLTSDDATVTTETVGERIRRLRLSRGISQRELSAPGISYAYISRIENGGRNPPPQAPPPIAGRPGGDPADPATRPARPAPKEPRLRPPAARVALR